MKPDPYALLGGAIILLSALLIYQPLLLPAHPEQVYPWGSDTWGHLVKVIYLDQQISQGHYYPDLFPQWYSGIQLLRYYAPLPYYLLLGLLQVTGNIWWAGNIFLFLTTLGGGLTFLLYRRWLGWLPAVAGGALFMALPDNLRVAFAEGNLPRALATALLPLAFYFFLRLLSDGRRRDFLGVALCVALMVLAHAMMAAIFMVCCGLFSLLVALMKSGVSGKDPTFLEPSPTGWVSFDRMGRGMGRGVLALGTGLLLSGWWLLPGLTGGITEIDQQAASDALARFPLTTSLDPMQRAGDLEAYYLGLSLVGGLALALFFWKRLAPWLRALTVTALVTGLISSTIAGDLYNALPFHQLFWPLRFLSFAGFAMLLATLGVTACLWRHRSNRRVNYHQLAALGVLVLLMLDFSPSLALVHGREPPHHLVRLSHRLAELPGWRVATADLSLLGSAPSYLFTYPGGREQVFGWAFQGSVTAPLLAHINQAMVTGHHPYAVDRLSLLGTDDVVVPRQREIPGAFSQALDEAGFRLEQATHDLELYHREGAPRAHTIPYQVLGIGRGAQNLALVFPQVVVGDSLYLDDYDPAFLGHFEALYLSGFKWRSKSDAEGLVPAFLEGGGRLVVVDLTGVAEDVMSRRPKFLDVYGEPVPYIDQPTLTSGGGERTLLPFDANLSPWNTHTPQGVDEALVEFTYPISSGTALGVKRLGEHRVHFLGLNLAYHALLTRDPVAVELLEDLLGLAAGGLPPRQSIPLEDYEAHQGGYRFSYRVNHDTPALVPVAHHAGIRVHIDGQRVPTRSIDQLTLVTLPAGSHQVEIRSGETPIYHAGRAATAAGVLMAAAYCIGLRRRWFPFSAWPGKRAASGRAAG